MRYLSSLLFILLMLAATARAQQTITVDGTVVDADSRAPIGGAIVTITTAGKRTYTNASGRFRLPVPAGTHTIRASSIGFRDTSITISTGSPHITIALRASSIPLQEVQVTAENNAEKIVRHAIERKNENQAKSRTVQGLLYSKIVYTLGGNGIGLTDIDRQAVLETFSRAYYSSRGPRLEVIQRRQTANVPAGDNLAALGNFISFYQDELPILGVIIPSPLNESTLSRYRFSIRDRTTLGGETVYVIDVKPATRLLPAFEGTIHIVANSYNLVAVDLRPSASTAIPYVRDLHFRQSFEKFQDDIWEPTSLDVSAKGGASLVSGLADVDLSISAGSIFTELKVNEPIPDSVYAGKKIISAAPDADSARLEFWENNRLSELTAEEKEIYTKTDSLVANRDTSNETPREGLGISPVVEFNRVGSASLGLGLDRALGPVDLDGHASYSFGLRRMFGDLTVTVPLIERRKRTRGISISSGEGVSGFESGTDGSLAIHAGIFSNLSATTSDRSHPMVINTMMAALFHRDYYDYFRKDGWRAGIDARAGELRAGVELEMSRQFSAPVTTNRSIFEHYLFRPNPAIPDGNYRTASATLQCGTPEALSGGTSDPELGAELTGLYGEETRSGRSFRGAEGTLRLLLPTIPTGYAPMLLDLSLRGGIGGDDLPTQYQFRMRTSNGFIGAPTGFIGSPGLFYSAPTGIYGGTRYAAVVARHDFTDILWRALGLPTYDGRGIGIAAAGASGYFENRGTAGYRSTGGTWYSEAGFDVGNIPTFVGNLIFLQFGARWGVGPLGAGRFGGVLGISLRQ
ncbi:MAG: hypothetical protein JWQ98_3166 [Chlorobi bacterium]|nr:hypothetical protein [Chlorobiota bacterium]